jgi:hypothetical protein
VQRRNSASAASLRHYSTGGIATIPVPKRFEFRRSTQRYKERQSMRKTMLAVAAAIALGTATIATGAMAAPHGGGGGHWGGGGGMHMGGGAPHFGGGPQFGGHPGGFAFRGRGFGWGGGLYAYGGPWYGGGCWVRRWVPTPFGWRWRLVNVCY